MAFEMNPHSKEKEEKTSPSLLGQGWIVMHTTCIMHIIQTNKAHVHTPIRSSRSIVVKVVVGRSSSGRSSVGRYY